MITAKKVRADYMGRVVDVDPQLKMPERPRFSQALVTIPWSGGLLVDGTEERQILRGRATQVFLPLLLPLLDGTRSIGQLQQEMPDFPPAAIHNALALLFTRGLLEDAAADPDIEMEDISGETLDFFQRHVDVTRANRSGKQALARLKESEVLVLARGEHALEADGVLVRSLQDAGVGAVRVLTSDDIETFTFEGGERLPRRLVVVLTDGDESPIELVELDQRCARLGVPWLRANIQPGALVADLGPYFERGETPCYRCFHSADASFTSPSDHGSEDQQSARTNTRLWANMLAVEALYLLTGIGPALTGHVIARYNLSDWTSQMLKFAKIPGCSYCIPLGSLLPTPDEISRSATALAYDSAVRFLSRRLLNLKSHQDHYRSSNIELSQQAKRYPSAARVVLPRFEFPRLDVDTLPAIIPNPQRPASARVSLTNLSELLMLSAGLRPADTLTGMRRRWTATGGNLGSVELYVAAADVAGLEPGFYFYQAQDHVLAKLFPDQNRKHVVEFMRETVPARPNTVPNAMIVMAGAVSRVAQKYSAFAYRVIHLDAGVALAQMQAVAGSLGFEASQASCWDEKSVSDWLGLIDVSEVPTAVIHICGA